MTLEQRLARQEAAEEVRALVADYAQACDTHDLKKLETIFAADIVISVPGTSWSGLDNAIAFYRDAWTTRPVPLRHFITNVAMRLLEPDHVDATSSFLYVDESDGRIGWGSYRDTFTRQEDRLLFSAKHIELGA